MTTMANALRYTATAQYCHCRHVFLLGPAGVGKTLAVETLLRKEEDRNARISTLRCTPFTGAEDICSAALAVATKAMSSANTPSCAVLILDGVGLLAQRLTNICSRTLSVLRRILDEGIYIPSRRCLFPLSIVCTSTTPLPCRVVMDRFVVVRCAPPTSREFARAAELCGRGPITKHLVAWESLCVALEEWMHRSVEDALRPPAACRDVYAALHCAVALLDDMNPTSYHLAANTTNATEAVRNCIAFALAMNIDAPWKGGVGEESTPFGELRRLVESVDIPNLASTALQVEVAEEQAGETLGARGIVPIDGTEDLGNLPRNTSSQWWTTSRSTDVLMEKMRWLLQEAATVCSRPPPTQPFRIPLFVGPISQTWQLLLQWQQHGSDAQPPILVLGDTMKEQQGGRPECVASTMMGGERYRDVGTEEAIKKALAEGRMLVFCGGAQHAYHYLSPLLDTPLDRVGKEVPVVDTGDMAIHEGARVVCMETEQDYRRLHPSIRSRFSIVHLDFNGVLPPSLSYHIGNWHRQFELVASPPFKATTATTSAGDTATGRGPVNVLEYAIPYYSFSSAESFVYNCNHFLSHSNVTADDENADDADTHLCGFLRSVARQLVSPRQLLRLSAVRTSLEADSGPCGPLSRLLDEGHAEPSTNNKDSLVNAFQELQKTRRELSIGDATHIFVFTSQRLPLPWIGAAWQASLRSTTEAAVHDITAMGTAEVAEIVHTLGARVGAVSGRGNASPEESGECIPIVFFIDDAVRGAVATNSLPFSDQLERLVLRWTSSGLNALTHLRIAFVVAVSENYSLERDDAASTQLLLPGSDWAALCVDELVPCEWVAVEQSTAAIPAIKTFAQASPLFTVSDILSTAPVRGTYCLSCLPLWYRLVSMEDFPRLLRRILQAHDNITALAQIMAEHDDVTDAVAQWVEALRDLFGVDTCPTVLDQTDAAHLINPLGNVMLKYIAATCQQCCSPDNVNTPLRCAGNHHGGPLPPSAAPEKGSVRSAAYHPLCAVALNIASHTIGVLFPTPKALADAAAACADSDTPLPLAITRHLLFHSGPGDSHLPVDICRVLSADSPSRLTLREVRLRQPFLCRGPSSSEAGPCPRLPLSYPLYRLVRHAVSFDLLTDDVVQSFLGVVWQNPYTSSIDNLVHDFLLYSLEDVARYEGPLAVSLTQETFNDDILWCLRVLLHLEWATTTTEDGPVEWRWNNLCDVAVFVVNITSHGTKWLVNAHEHCVTLVRDNLPYVQYVRKMWPLSPEAAAARFSSTLDFTAQMTFHSVKLQRGCPDGVDAAPANANPTWLNAAPSRLRASPRELAFLNGLLAKEDRDDGVLDGDGNSTAARVRRLVSLHSLSYILLPEDYPSANSEGKLPDALGAHRPAVESLLLAGTASGEGVAAGLCQWLHKNIRESRRMSPGCSTWMQTEVAPVLIAYILYHLAQEDDAAATEENKERAKASIHQNLLRCVVDTETGELYAPQRTVYFLLRSVLEVWMHAGDTGGPVPFEEFDDAVTRNAHLEFPHLIFVAAVHALEEEVQLVRGRERLWDLIEDGWKKRQDEEVVSTGSTNTVSLLLLCLAAAVLHVDIRAYRDSYTSTRTGSTPCTLQQQRTIARRLEQFQASWTAMWRARTDKKDPQSIPSDDGIGTAYPIYVLFLRLLSEDGVDLATGKRLFQRALTAAAGDTEGGPDFSDEPVLAALLIDDRDAFSTAVLQAILDKHVLVGDGNSCGDETDIPAAAQQVVRDGARLLISAARQQGRDEPQLQERLLSGLPEGEVRDACSAYLSWVTNANDNDTDPPQQQEQRYWWNESEVRQCLAALTLYFFAGDCVGSPSSQSPPTPQLTGARTFHHPLDVLHGRGKVEIAIDTVMLPRVADVGQDGAQAAAVTRALLCATALSRQILTGSHDFLFPRHTMAWTMAEEWVVGLLPSCPRCHLSFHDYTACCGLMCANPQCQTFFCAWCLADCVTNEAVHHHVLRCPLSRNKGSFFANRELWYAAYLNEVFRARLAALTQRRSLTCTVNGNTGRFFRELSPGEERILASLSASDMDYVRYKAMQAIVDFGFRLGVEAGLIDRVLIHSAKTGSIPPVQLVGMDLCCAALEDALTQVSKLSLPAARHSPALALKYVLATASAARLNQSQQPLTDERLRGVHGDVNLLTAGAQHAEAQKRLSVLMKRVGDAAATPLSFLFRPVGGSSGNNNSSGHVAEESVRGIDDEDAEGVEEARVLQAVPGLRLLDAMSSSFTRAAAERLQFVLDFACDARRVVRLRFTSQRDVKATSLAALTKQHPSLFPQSRVRDFIAACRRLLRNLNRADNQCHAGQAFTIAEAKSVADVSLAEAVLMDEGRLLNVLFTGSDAVGDADPEHVGYGNAEAGQNRILEGLRDLRLHTLQHGDTAKSAFLLDAHVDLLQLPGRSPMRLLLDVLGNSPIVDSNVNTSGSSEVVALIARATVGMSPGLLARPLLPVTATDLELDSGGVLGLLAGVQSWLAEEPFEADLVTTDHLHGNSSCIGGQGPPGDTAPVNWYARARAELDALAKSVGATAPRKTFHEDLVGFITAYACQAAMEVSGYPYAEAVREREVCERECLHKSAEGISSPLSLQQPSPPPFSLVPLPILLTPTQRQVQLATIRTQVHPMDAPMLLVAAFPLGDDEEREDSGEEEEEAVRALRNLACGVGNCPTSGAAMSRLAAIVVGLRLVAVTSHLVGKPLSTPLCDAIHGVLDLECYDMAARLAECVGSALELSSLARVIAGVEGHLR